METSDRRTCLKHLVMGTAASLGGPLWTGRALAEVDFSTAVLRLRVTDYPALSSPGGSIQLKFSDVQKPFTLNRVTADRFVTLDSICTHSGCTVGRFISADNRMRCPCHGSRYDIEGRVFRDPQGNSTEPATDDLARFQTTFDPGKNIVSIAIPGISLGLKSIATIPLGGGIHRSTIIFPVTGYSVYEVHHQPDLSSTFQLIPFSMTANGPADRLFLAPELDGDATVFVETPGPRGFFVVAIRLDPVP